ncbi:MAG: FHA domain-containing protein [candidate division WOR-3 bacterium]
MLKLVLQLPYSGVEREVAVEKVPFTIGSAPTSDLVIATLAPEHMLIERRGESYFLQVKHPGIKVNDKPLMGEVLLFEGDKVVFLGGRLLVKEMPVVLEEGSQATQFLPMEELPYFKVLSGPVMGAVYELGNPGILGRGEDADYRLDDPYISRRHLRIHIVNEKIEVEDIGGKNPVLVNGKPLLGRTRLSSGDELAIGKTRLLFIDPSEKSESEVFAARGGKRVPIAIWASLGAVGIIIIGIGVFLFFQQRAQTYTNAISGGKSAFSSAQFITETEGKVREYKRAEESFKKALSIKKNDPEASEWLTRSEKYLQGWTSVARAETLVAQKNLSEALSLLEAVMAEPEFKDERYIGYLYDDVLRNLFVIESYNTAKQLYLEKRDKEALNVLSMALSTAPDHPQLLALEQTIRSAKKESKEEREKKLAVIAQKSQTQTGTVPTYTDLGVKKPQIEMAQPSIDIGKTSGVTTGSSGLGKPSVDLSAQLPSVGNLNLETGGPKVTGPTGPSISLDTKLDKVGDLKKAYDEEHNIDKAYRIAQQILNEDPKNTTAKMYARKCELERKARAYEKNGDKENALKYWEQLLSLDPGNKWAKEGISRNSQ